MTQASTSIIHYYDCFIKAHPLSKFLFWTSTGVIFLIICLFIYVGVFEIDVVTSAYGKIIPEGKIKTIQPIIGGKISNINVQEGQLVQANDVLLTLDPTQYEHDLTAASKELELLDRKISRTKTLIETLQDSDLTRILIINFTEDNGLHNELSSFNEQIKEIHDTLESNMLELRIIDSKIATSQKNIEYTTYQIENAKKLLLAKVVPKTFLIELQNKLQNLMHEQEQLNYSYKVKQKNIEILESKLKKLKTDLLSKSYYELDQYNKDQNLTIGNIKKLKYDIQNMIIKSPITGYVENLKLFTLGGVVASGEELMNIVPFESKTKLEANLQSKDIGFVGMGQQVAIKLDAFPYTQYGTLQGKVCKIASDSFTSDNQNYYYKIDVCLDTNFLKVKGNNHSINTGYTAQVDIYTDRRKIIDFFISPIKVAISNSFREK